MLWDRVIADMPACYRGYHARFIAFEHRRNLCVRLACRANRVFACGLIAAIRPAKNRPFVSKDNFLFNHFILLMPILAGLVKKDKTHESGQTVAPIRWLYLLIPKRRRAKRETAQTVTGAVVQLSN
jgi:hypothetical protein